MGRINGEKDKKGGSIQQGSQSGLVRLINSIFSRPSVQAAKRVKTAEVFRENAYELDYTYVTRPNIENDVRNKLRHDNAIVLFSGPTKSGKTVLCHRFAGDDRPCAHIHVFQTMTADEFWAALRQSIEAPEATEIVTERERRLAARQVSKLTGGIPGLSGHLTDETQMDEVTRRTRKVVVPQSGRIGVLSFLQSSPHTIIIDDFHWMNPAIKIDIFPPLKQLLGYGTRIILISVSKSAFPMIGDFGDFAGRFIEISMPPWEHNELRRVAEVGFPLLGMKVTPQTIDNLVGCSYLSPLLMQGLCAQLCYEREVTETVADELQVEELSRNDVGEMAGRYAAPLTTSFDTILDSGGERSWQTKPRDGRRLTIAEVLVLGISHRRPFEPISLDSLVTRLGERVLQKPVSSSLAASLVNKTLEIQKKYGGDRQDRAPIYYDAAAKTITMVDPYFKLWARWVRGPALGGNLFAD
jgi:hypothetical protein